jgi:hypothetical protein
MKNLKTTMIVVMLMLAAVGSAVAQEKYEYACVYYNSSENVVSTSINGVDFEKEKITIASTKGLWDLNPAIKKVLDMQEKGWEVYNSGVSSAPNGVIYFLKKKKG